jgi:ATP-dependent Lon protease
MDIGISEKQGLLENFKLSDRTNKIIGFANNLHTEDKLSREVVQKMRADMDKRTGNISGVLGNNGLNDIMKLESKLQSLSLQEETKTYVLEELNRMKSMPRNHPEHNMIRNYLETVASLPWALSTKDNYDLDNAQSQLDKDHFGLEKIKKRIVEYIAVRGLKNDAKGSILCFTGPPGVGKTSLGQSIAAAIGRKFHRVALGGVRDEAEIRGHRRTYIGSLPGVFIQVLSK